jgi:hypothetical protein
MSVVDLQSYKPPRGRGPNPHTKEHKLLSGIDWRTREGKFLVNARRELAPWTVFRVFGSSYSSS